MVKGIILAGGSGTRLYPATNVVSKQLLPVYDKPMIYYSLSVLMLAGIRDLLLISTPQDIARFEDLLQDGSQWGVKIQYAVQPKPEGLAQAYIIAKDFIGSHRNAMVLGDNLFFGNDLSVLLQRAAAQKHGAMVFGYKVQDPQRYGVIQFSPDGKPVSIIEKPAKPPSKYAVTGLYFYDHRVVEFAQSLKPSARGELEITDINRCYLERGELEVVLFRRGMTWLDMGTFESMLDASLFIQTVQTRQGIKIACPEEVAYRMGYIPLEQLHRLASHIPNAYGEYLLEIASEEKSKM